MLVAAEDVHEAVQDDVGEADVVGPDAEQQGVDVLTPDERRDLVHLGRDGPRTLWWLDAAVRVEEPALGEVVVRVGVHDRRAGARQVDEGHGAVGVGQLQVPGGLGRPGHLRPVTPPVLPHATDRDADPVAVDVGVDSVDGPVRVALTRGQGVPDRDDQEVPHDDPFRQAVGAVPRGHRQRDLEGALAGEESLDVAPGVVEGAAVHLPGEGADGGSPAVGLAPVELEVERLGDLGRGGGGIEVAVAVPVGVAIDGAVGEPGGGGVIGPGRVGAPRGGG